MRDDDGAEPSYEVVLADLARAALDVEAITQSAGDGVLEDLPSRVSSLGDEQLASAFADFCARWDVGLSHLVGDSREMATRLRATASCYTREDDAVARSYRAATSGLRLVVPGPPDVLAAWGSSGVTGGPFG